MSASVGTAMTPSVHSLQLTLLLHFAVVILPVCCCWCSLMLHVCAHAFVHAIAMLTSCSLILGDKNAAQYVNVLVSDAQQHTIN